MTTRRAFLAQVAALAAASAGRAADPKRPPRILLRSSWQTVNIGDIGHTPGMLRLLADHLPAAEVTLWPGNIGDGVDAMLRKNFPKVRVAQGKEVREAFDRCDFLLHGSGPSLVALKQLAQWKQEAKKPYGVLGVTLGSLDAAARDVLDGAAFLYLRDTVSLKYAKDQGLKCPVIEFAPDAAFGVSLRDDATATAFLQANGLEDGKFICAIPRLRYTQYWLIRKKEMTDTDRQRHGHNETHKEADHAKVREAIVAAVRDGGVKVLVCPEDQSHMAVGKEMIVDKLPADVRAKVVWRERYWLTDEAVSVYVRSAGLLSMDMHSPIMAVANGTPAVHCRFAEQTSKGRMWADVGLTDWLFDLDEETDGSRITRAVLDILKSPKDAQAKAAQAMTIVNERHKAAFGTLAKALPAG